MKHSRGFSLFELMVVIGLLGILLGLAVPSFRSFSRNNSLTAIQNDLVTSFNLARSEALRRNRPVSVCASADGTTCGEDTDWNNGWIAFTDRATAGVIDGDDALLNAWESANPGLLFSSHEDVFVQYSPTGMSSSGDPMIIDVSWDDCVGVHKRRVTVTPTGAITGQIVDCSEE